MGDARQRIEQQLTMLFRRAQRVHLMGAHEDIDLDRSAYAILCRIDDEGPQRLGALATVFGLDPSTITRQVQALERAGLAARSTDARDRRVSLLALTEPGLAAVHATRQHRRNQLNLLLADWPEDEVNDFAALLERLNDSLNRLIPEGQPAAETPGAEPVEGGGESAGERQR
ncbi:MAG TPA: MarR family transcriptional regulator [Nocardioidaceae bacterium]|nr:MarR family transcriptional regulator [Nocardioidaceae bacterium]